MTKSILLDEHKKDLQKVLSIIAKYHPAFGANASLLHLPARALALQVADNAARDLGYESAKDAVDGIQNVNCFFSSIASRKLNSKFFFVFIK